MADQGGFTPALAKSGRSLNCFQQWEGSELALSENS